MNGIAHIWSSVSAPWCGWVMLGLLLCAILSERYQPGVITQAKNSLLAQTDRTYKESPETFLGQLLITLFRIGTLAMALYLCSPVRSFSFVTFGVLCGWITAVVLAKMGGNILVDYTFGVSRRYGNPYEHYGNIATLAAVVLYPMLLILLHVGNYSVSRWVLGVVVVLFILAWTYRVFRQFVSSPMHILYVLVYILTLDIIPYAGLYILSEQSTHAI